MQTSIHPLAFHSALLRGASMVERKKDELNRINGFPVPDRDTGSNLAYLMKQLRRQLPCSANFDELLPTLCEAALMGARGNSGAIFSQYFSGFREAASGLTENIREALPLHGLAAMFQEGYASAFRSIQNPREGTILTAMRSFSDAFHGLVAQGGDLARAGEAALRRLKQTVEESIHVLPQQRALRAPDAGAMAFLYFIEGFLYALLGLEDAQTEAEGPLFFELPPAEAEGHEVPENSAFRYCTEVMLTLRDGAPIGDDMKQKLAALGDSMVITQAGSLARVHLHTNEPARAADLLESLGTLGEIKADDMRMQQALSRSHPGKAALVIDSVADVPEELLGPDVYMLPMNLLAQGVSWQDKRSISLDRVRRMAGKLSSSQLNPEEVRRFLDPIVQRYEEVLVLTVSSRMSGLHERFGEYVRQDGSGKVRLVDTRTNSGAEGLLALHASRRLQQGARTEELAAELEDLRGRVKIFVSLPSLKAMVASGRLKENVGKVLQAIGFLPLVTVNREGEGTVTGLSFSRARSDRLLLDKLEKGRVKEYAVIHANDLPRARAAAVALEERLGFAPSYICEISSVVANFSGEGSWAVAFLEHGPHKGDVR